MIALINDLDKQKVNKNSKSISKTQNLNTLGRLRHALANVWANRQKRKTDTIALRQLMQLDDALLRDMGISRYDLMSIKSGSLTFDSLVKHQILSNRDNACSTTSLRK